MPSVRDAGAGLRLSAGRPEHPVIRQIRMYRTDPLIAGRTRLRALVLEQGKVAGGCSQVFRRRGRYEFDVGVHYVGECQPGGAMWSVLRGLGLEELVEFACFTPTGYSTPVFPDLTFRVPRGWDAYLARLIETFLARSAASRAVSRCCAGWPTRSAATSLSVRARWRHSSGAPR